MSVTAYVPTLSAPELAALQHTLSPLAKAHTLPPWCYTSEAFYEVEVREIFMKEWLGICRVDEIPSPGDYYCADIAEEPIVVLRDKEGELRALSRTCRHRGACVMEGRGNARFFRCPFHGWTYDLRGRLIAAPYMEDTDGFDSADWPLAPLRLEVWQGVIFVNFDPEAEPLAPRLAGLTEAIRGHRLGDLRASGPMPFWNRCNWKLSTEQAMDMYHVPDTHYMPRSSSRVAKTHFQEGGNEHWTLSISPLERLHPYITGTNQNRTPFPAVEGLDEAGLSTLTLLHVYPTTVIGLLPHGALTFFIFPQGVGRTNITLNLWFTEAGFAMEGYDEALREAQEGFIVTNNQDMYSARLTQRGLKSRFMTTGRFSYLEEASWALGRYVARRLAGLAEPL